MKKLWMVCLLAGAIAGCAKPPSILDLHPKPDRAAYGNDVIDLRSLPPEKPGTPGAPTPAPAPTPEPGNWTYTVPASVTSEEHKTADVDEVSMFVGRPGPNDLPFMVITTTRSRTIRAEHDTAFKIQQEREYSMNGNIVKEYTGLTGTGAGFSELMIRRPGTTNGVTDDTQVCHAIALARTEEEQKLALSILSSITWTPAK